MATETAKRESQRDRREGERERQVRIDGLRKRAARQALSIWTSTSWTTDTVGNPVFAAAVRNDSEDVIREVVIRWRYQENGWREWTAEMVRSKGGGPLEYTSVESFPIVRGDELPLEIEFTDIYADRWLLRPDRSIELLQERTFRLPEDEA